MVYQLQRSRLYCGRAFFALQEGINGLLCGLVSRYLAEWMTYGYPTANVWPLDIKRFGNLQSSRTFLRHRVMEVMRE